MTITSPYNPLFGSPPVGMYLPINGSFTICMLICLLTSLVTPYGLVVPPFLPHWAGQMIVYKPSGDSLLNCLKFIFGKILFYCKPYSIIVRSPLHLCDAFHPSSLPHSTLTRFLYRLAYLKCILLSAMSFPLVNFL